MKGFSLICISVLISFWGHSHQKEPWDIEQKDSVLMGKPLFFAINKLGLEKDWTIIEEPMRKIRGIWTKNNDTCMIQIYVKTSMPRIDPRGISRLKWQKKLYRRIKFKRVIGISWTKYERCRSIGEVLWHYSPMKFGGC